MRGSHVFRAWKWLLAHLVIAASVGYLSTLLLGILGVVEPATLRKAASLGLPHVGALIKQHGVTSGVNEGVMIFFCNLIVALLIVATVYWVRLLNPHNQSRKFARLREHLQNDRSAVHLRKIPPFAHIQSSQLRLASFMLLGAPYIATITLGAIAGHLIGIVHVVSSSPLVALAYVMPHGIPEISGMLLACSVPVGTWMSIRPAVDKESTSAAFLRIDRVLASRQFQRNMKMIVNLLMIAGLIEAFFTLKVVAIFSGG